MEKDANNNVVPLRGTHLNTTALMQKTSRPVASTPYFAFIEHLKSTPPNDLNIIIDFKKIYTESETEFSAVELLCEESKLWAALLGKRNIKSLWLLHPFTCPALFEITRIIHCIASNFNVETSINHYKASSCLNDINKEKLALLKGLGFSSFHLIVGSKDLENLEKLASYVQLIRNFLFNDIGIHLQHVTNLNSIRDLIPVIKETCNPDFISMGNNPIFTRHEDTCETDFEFIQGGRKHTNTLHLGPEGESNIGGLGIQNFCCLSKYKNALDAKRLPIHPGNVHFLE